MNLFLVFRCNDTWGSWMRCEGDVRGICTVGVRNTLAAPPPNKKPIFLREEQLGGGGISLSSWRQLLFFRF